MTREELVTRLKTIADSAKMSPDGRGDPENDHETADVLLLQFINDPEVTGLYESIERWYA